jgi:hypothetical protein
MPAVHASVTALVSDGGMRNLILASVVAVAVVVTGPAAAGASSGPTGKAAMSPPTNCSKIKNKQKLKRCRRQHQG